MADDVIQQPVLVLACGLFHKCLMLLQLDLTLVHVQHIPLPIATIHAIALLLIVNKHTINQITYIYNNQKIIP